MADNCDEISNISKILINLRRELYLTQEEIGDEIGLSRSRIAEIENTKYDEDLPLEVLFRLFYMASTLKENPSMNNFILHESTKLLEIAKDNILSKIITRYNNKQLTKKGRNTSMKNYLPLKQNISKNNT